MTWVVIPPISAEVSDTGQAAGMAQAMLKRAADVGDFHPAAHGFLID
jgi:hypothetical protein